MSELSISQRECFALELSTRPDGYLTPVNDVIIGLREAGLLTTTYVSDGFVIARAVPPPAPAVCDRLLRNGRWIQQYRTHDGRWVGRSRGRPRSEPGAPA